MESQWTTYTRIVGDVITAERMSRRSSQAAFARELRVSQATLSRIERGEQPVSVEQLADIADVWGVRPNVILAEADRLADKLEASGVSVYAFRPKEPAPAGLLAFGAGALTSALAILATKDKK